MFLSAAFDQLFSCFVSDVDYIASNDRMIDKWWTGMDLKGMGVAWLRHCSGTLLEGFRKSQNLSEDVRNSGRNSHHENRLYIIMFGHQSASNCNKGSFFTVCFGISQYVGLVMSESSVNDSLWTGKDLEGDMCGPIDVFICLTELTELMKHIGTAGVPIRFRKGNNYYKNIPRCMALWMSNVKSVIPRTK